MINFLIRIAVVAVTIVLVSQFVPGIEVGSVPDALLAALVLGVLNALVKPVLFILTLPITLLTLGLFSFVLNAFMFWLAGYMLEGFTVTGFIPALIGSVIVGIVTAVIHRIVS